MTLDVHSLILAGLPPATLQAATGFGSDLSCTADLDPNGRTVSGRRLVAEAVFRRLTTPRGRLIDDPNYGYDLGDMLNDEVTPTASALAQMQAAVQAECFKDERVVSARVSQNFMSDVLTVAIELDTGDGPFPLVLAVTSVTVTLLRAPT